MRRSRPDETGDALRVTESALPGVLIIEPLVAEDPRGHFHESWHGARYAAAGIPDHWVQDNVSSSRRGVLRGLHFQHPHAQAKLVAVLAGAVYDVAVDLRPGSPGFGRWFATELSAENRRQLFIPEGFAHGFLALSDVAVFTYKCSDYYDPSCEHCIRWDDPDLAIVWPESNPVLSARDAAAPRLRDLPPGVLAAAQAVEPTQPVTGVARRRASRRGGPSPESPCAS